MKLKDLFSAIGRPRAIEGEQMVISTGLLASMVRPQQGGVYFLPVDEIVRRQGWRTYQDMENDDQVKATLAFKRILVVGRKWALQPADKTPQAQEIADFVTWCMCKINMDYVLREACTAFQYGYSLGELVWTRDTYDGKQVVCLEKLPHRDPKELYLKIDTHGNYIGVQQQSLGQIINIVPEKTWLYSYDKHFGNLYGNSDLRAAYRSWWAKKFLINFWNVFLERMGAPMMTMKYPTGSSNDLKETLKSIMKNLASKTEVLIPEGVTIDLVEATRGGTATYSDALSYHDNAIARSILLPAVFGLGGENEKSRGADSQSTIQLRLIFKMADQISNEISSSFMEQVAKQIVFLNYGQDAVDNLMPNFFWQDYAEYQATLIADEIRQLHIAGVIDMDQDDINVVRSLVSLPQRGRDDKPDELVRPAPPPPPGGATPPPPAAQGNSRADKGGSATGDSTTDKSGK